MVLSLSEWFMGDLDDAVGRLRAQVLACVPEERRVEQPGGGNSILWGIFHVARHAALALSVVSPGDGPSRLFSAFESSDLPGGGGLEENEQPWAKQLTVPVVEHYFDSVGDATRRYLATVRPEQLEDHPDTQAALARAGISPEEFGWLYRMWSGQPVSFFVRWPLLGHLVNHVGEMIATRNRMGLSPF